jgi:outer membrane protein TolC
MALARVARIPAVRVASRKGSPYVLLFVLVIVPAVVHAQAGSVSVTQTTLPGATTSVNTVSPTIQVAGALAGGISSAAKRPFTGTLTLRDAVQRGLDYNLGSVNVAQAVKQARGQRTIARSALLPNLVGDLTSTVQQLNLAAMGFGGFESSNSQFQVPEVVGPFTYTDLRARLSQSVLNLANWNTYRASQEVVRASELTERDTRDLVVLAVGGTYLQVVAARARVESMRAQLETATTLLRQAQERRAVGVVAQVDVDRSQIQALTQQQRLTSLQNDLAKQKINLVRMIGLPPTDQYELSDVIPFAPLPAVTLEDALRQAREQRADLQAAEARVRASERTLSANRAERLPAISVNADYGRIGANLGDAHGTYAVVGRVQVPLWRGGRDGGQIAQAEAVLAQRQAELENAASEVEAEVRKVYLDLEAASSQVDLAQKNVEVSKRALDLTRQRFEAGVSDSVEVVQAQESVSTAELDYINSVFAHNIGKLNLARATGQAAARLSDFLKLPGGN